MVASCHVTLIVLPRCKVAFCVICYNYLLQYLNSPSPSETFLRKFQNLRTVIVTADIHPGLHNRAFDLTIKHPSRLTFGHWSGVTPYTSSCEFAGSCVFGKQLPEKL